MQQRPDGYVPLWCKSNFSFLEGAGHPGELVDACHRLGLPAVFMSGVYANTTEISRSSGHAWVGLPVAAKDPNKVRFFSSDSSSTSLTGRFR